MINENKHNVSNDAVFAIIAIIQTRAIPQPKVQIRINNVHRHCNTIYFTTASNYILAEAEYFGKLDEWTGANEYRLVVDTRYDIQEIVDYLKTFE